MSKLIKIKFPLLCIAIALCFGSCNNKKDKNLSFISIETFQTEVGWGYDIKVNNKNYIHQPFIPVIGGQHGFPTKEAAFNTAKIVVEKMKKNEIPSLTQDDLKRAGVSLKEPN